jgi:hypothetical protein
MKQGQTCLTILSAKTQTFDDRLSEPYGVRDASWICLSACHPNRVQAKLMKRNAGFMAKASEAVVEDSSLGDPICSPWTAGLPVLFPLMLCAPLLEIAVRAVGSLTSSFLRMSLPITLSSASRLSR